MILVARGDFADAIKVLQEIPLISQERRERFAVRLTVAAIQFFAGDLEGARREFTSVQNEALDRDDEAAYVALNGRLAAETVLGADSKLAAEVADSWSAISRFLGSRRAAAVLANLASAQYQLARRENAPPEQAARTAVRFGNESTTVVDAYDRAAKEFRDTGDLLGLAGALNNLGLAKLDLALGTLETKLLDEAAANFAEALSLLEPLQAAAVDELTRRAANVGVAQVFGNQGVLQRRRGKLDDADKLHEKSGKLAASIAYGLGEARQLANRGNISVDWFTILEPREVGRLNDAKGYFKPAKDKLEKIGARPDLKVVNGSLDRIQKYEDCTPK